MDHPFPQLFDCESTGICTVYARAVSWRLQYALRRNESMIAERQISSSMSHAQEDSATGRVLIYKQRFPTSVVRLESDRDFARVRVIITGIKRIFGNSLLCSVEFVVDNPINT